MVCETERDRNLLWILTSDRKTTVTIAITSKSIFNVMSFSHTNRCILIIDDETDLCRIVKVTLERLKGWEVLITESAQEGMAQAQTQQPDVILLDLTLPGGNGLSLLQTLKTNPTTHSIPVLLFTATDPSDDSLKFGSSDIAGAIFKPFNVLQLAERIAEQLGW
jgi:DNA-binding response OmpR family regulator